MRKTLLMSLGLALGCSGSNAPEPNEMQSPPSQAKRLAFDRFMLDAEADGPAFSTLGDLNGDGRTDILVSQFGVVQGPTLPTGSVVAYLQGSDLRSWTKEVVLPESEGLIWPNELTLHDIDADGDLDVFVPYGFLICPILDGKPCGGLAWFERSDDGWTRHDLVSSGAELFYSGVVLADIDQDGIDDLVTVGELRRTRTDQRAETQWFKGNDSETRFETAPRTISDGLGSLPSVLDIDGDGDLDLASAEYFAGLGASFAWYENADGAWNRHVIDADSGPAIQLSFIDDFLGDGRLVAVGANHTNTVDAEPDPWESAVFMYTIPSDPTQPWARTQISEHIVSRPSSPTGLSAAPGIFGWGDADGDGDIDLLVSGDGDPRLFLMEHTAPGEFAMHVMEDSLGQAGSTKIADLNGDGVAEMLASGYEDGVLHLYVQSDEGAHPVGLATTPAPASTDGVTFEVQYEGALTGNLLIALFEEYPPMGPPSGFKLEVGAEFPATVEVAGLSAGTYTALVVLDVAPFDPMTQGPEDLQTIVELTVPHTGWPIEATLVDGMGPGAPGPGGNGPRNDVEVTLDYAGAETGQVVVAVFDSLPPTGPPVKFELVPVEAFPATVMLEDVPGGTKQILAFLDLPPSSLMAPGPEDPQAASAPLEMTGELMQVGLTLELP